MKRAERLPFAAVVAPVLAAVLLIGLTAPTPTWAAEPLKIMPLGDSITEAVWKTDGKMSYRYPLWNLLKDKGYSGLDFVGSKTGVKNNTNPPGDWDKNHEGHTGWRADEIINGRESEPGAGRLSQWASTYDPDIALVHVGSNDVNQGQSVASTVADISQIIDVLRAANPQMDIMVAQVIPWTKTTTTQKAVVELNAAIPQLASKSTAESKVIVVDQNSGYDPLWNYDKIHPGPSGMRSLAERWTAAMEAENLLPPPVNAAPIVSAGSDRTVVLPSLSAPLDGTVTDDGRPGTGTASVVWSQDSGPGTATFADASAVDTTVTLPGEGTYVLRLTASDGQLSSTDTMTVAVVAEAPPTSGRVSQGLLALYEFDENAGDLVHDTSGSGAPLDLTIANPAATQWSPGALKLSSSTVLDSTVAATKVINGVSATNALTLEAWVRPSTVTRTGTTRIITLSSQSSTRNMMLGQSTSRVEARLRTSDTAWSGQATFSPYEALRAGELAHIAYTRAADGTSTVYVNGQPVTTSTVSGSIAGYWNSAFRLRLGLDADGSGPWLGTYHLAAVYDRALSYDEITTNFTRGPDPTADEPPPPPANTAPVVSAGPDRAVVLPTSTASLDGSVSDDGLPGPGAVTVSWSQESGPVGASFENASAVDTTVTLPEAGSYVLRLTATDGELSASDTMTVTVTAESPPPPPPSGRVSDGLVALYEFGENAGSVAQDTSGVGEPLNLTIANPAATEWRPGALALKSSTVLSSGVAATKVIEAVSASNAITLEAWVDPATVSRTGTSRIVTLSKQSSTRNFMLGQTTSRVEARLRTSATYWSGQGTFSPYQALTGGLVHMVYTRDATGTATVYVDGQPVTTNTAGGSIAGYWNTSFALRLGQEADGTGPWTGEYNLVAIYARALTPTEITTNYSQGANP